MSALLKANMAENMNNLNAERALVPSHYAILLHAEVYEELSPAFQAIAGSLAEDLTTEVEKLCYLTYTPDGSKPRRRDTPRDIRPLDNTWSFEWIPVTEVPDKEGGPPRTVPRHYLAVSSQLARQDLSPLDDGKAKMTVKDPFKGVFESHFILKSDLKNASKDTVTVRVPFAPLGRPPVKTPEKPSNSPPGAGTPLRTNAGKQPPARLTYQYPGQAQALTYEIVKPETRIGRKQEGHDQHIDLRLDATYVSREHARIQWNADKKRFELLDTSSNGTLVNGVAVPKSKPLDNVFHWHPLPDGARIDLAGGLTLTFLLQKS
jgi:hypothetical protein